MKAPTASTPPHLSLTLRLADGRAVQREGLFAFTPAQEAEILRSVRLTRGYATANPFIHALRIAIGSYQDLKSLNEEVPVSAHSHRAVRKLLKTVSALVDQLSNLRPPDFNRLNIVHQVLHQVDAATTQSNSSPKHQSTKAKPPAIDQAVTIGHWMEKSPRFPGWLQELLDHLQELQRVALTLESTKSRMPRGPKPNVQRLQLGRQIAKTFIEILKRRPTKGRNSAYENTLRLCLQAAGEFVGDAKSRKDLHALVAAALKGM